MIALSITVFPWFGFSIKSELKKYTVNLGIIKISCDTDAK